MIAVTSAFSDTYARARARFLEAAAQAGEQLGVGIAGGEGDRQLVVLAGIAHVDRRVDAAPLGRDALVREPRRGARLEIGEGRAHAAARLYQQVQALPVTGRQPAMLDPVAVEVGFARNIRLDDGDRLIYPKRVDEVQVLGAVAEPCHLPYQPLQEAREYLQGCSILADAEADYLWLIQPNGVSRRVGIAHWNRESGQFPVAGSKILVPVKNDDLDPPLPELNQQLAEFIATQLAEVVR